MGVAESGKGARLRVSPYGSHEAIIYFDKYKDEFKKWLEEKTLSVAKDYFRRLERLIGGKKIYEPHKLASSLEE